MKYYRVLLLGLLSLSSARAATYALPEDGGQVVGEIQIVTSQAGDTLGKIAEIYELGYNEIVAANPTLSKKRLPEGTEVVIPTRYILPDTAHEGIVINLAEMRLYYFPSTQSSVQSADFVWESDTDSLAQTSEWQNNHYQDTMRSVVTFPVAIGKAGWGTPQASTYIKAKHRNPTWTPPASIRREAAARGRRLRAVYPAGPRNPLGTRALRLGIAGYLIHGTNKPNSIGKRRSHGCIRMRRDDVETLFDMVEVGTPVTIINQPLKVAASAEGLLIELHKPLREKRLRPNEIRHRVQLWQDSSDSAYVNSDLLENLIDSPNGMPTNISEVSWVGI